MRLGWTKNKSSTTYRVVKTIRVNKKNKTLPRNQTGTGISGFFSTKKAGNPRPCLVLYVFFS